MSTDPSHKPNLQSISAEHFPALRSFLRGYLHQDMSDEYNSVEEAVSEFCADASAEERSAVARDWSRFVDQTKALSLEQVNRILTGPLGSSQTLTQEDIQRLSAALSRE